MAFTLPFAGKYFLVDVKPPLIRLMVGWIFGAN
jgi:hypothetical protein